MQDESGAHADVTRRDAGGDRFSPTGREERFGYTRLGCRLARAMQPFRMTTDGETIAKLRLARTDGVGPLTFRRLIERFSTAAEALAGLPDVAASAGRAQLSICPERDAEREMAALRKTGARLLCVGDAAYPYLLTLLPDPPPVLTVLGDINILSTRCVALVGARNASANGTRMAEALATDLAANAITVVSGMARGIDAAAHIGALHIGRTIAATAGGIDQPYPAEHAALQARIAAAGAVVTEAPWGTAPQSRHFPRRNRIIAGLALGVVVVEAALRSGSLITARIAQDANREIFAVPGSPLDPRCRGCNDLIRQGAHVTESADDVLAQLPDSPLREGLTRMPLFARNGLPGMAEPAPHAPPPPDADLPRVRAELRRLLSASPTDIDAVIRHSQFAPAAVMAALSQLELALAVEILPGGRVALLAAQP
jgi:DNA processing protein